MKDYDIVDRHCKIQRDEFGSFAQDIPIKPLLPFENPIRENLSQAFPLHSRTTCKS
jgi:hypothetical protein